jgi:hypothetical protein
MRPKAFQRAATDFGQRRFVGHVDAGEDAHPLDAGG